MKKAILTSILFSLFQLATMQAQHSGKLTLTSCYKNVETFTLDMELEGDLDVTYWDKDYVKIEIQIKSDNGNASILRYLNSLGRYLVDYSSDKYATTMISMPNLPKRVTVNGKKYCEELTFKVYVPQGLLTNDLYVVDDLLVKAE